MTNVIVSIAAFALGLIPLWRMFAVEKAVGAALMPVTTTFFFAQHIACSFSGLIMAAFDNEHTYFNDQGVFLYRDGMIRWQMVNLAALYSAFIGVEITKRLYTHRPRETPVVPVAGSYISVCYVSLALHALIICLQWAHMYVEIPKVPRYAIQVLAPIVVATFYFWGLWWNQMKSHRRVFAGYALLYGAAQMVSGNRGTFVAAVFLFCLGYFLNRKRGPVVRELVLIGSLLALLLWLITISENVRILYSSRQPETASEWIARATDLLMGAKRDDREAAFVSIIAQSAAAIMQFSPFDVVARTPEEVPFRGWTEQDWALMASGFRPEMEVSEVETAYISGSLATLDYGWHSNPVGGSAMPMSLVADAWRRFGYAGIAGTYLLWGMLLLNVSVFCGRRNTSKFIWILGGAVLAIVYHLYTVDILALICPLPKRAIACLGYALLTYLGCAAVDKIPHRHRSPKRPVSGKEHISEQA